MVESREVINAVSSSKEQMVKSPPRNDVGITNNRDAGRNSNPTSSMLPSNQVCSVYIKKNSHLSNTRNVRSVKGREQTTRKSTGTSKKVGTHAAGTEQNVVVDGTESSSNLKRIKSPSKNSLTGEFVANAVRRQLVCALVPSTEEPKRKDEKRRKKEKRSNATRNKTEEQGSNVRDDTIPPVSNNNESIDLNLITDRGDETGICGLEDSEQINDSCLQETASDPILHGENGENWSSIGENYDSEVPCQIQHSASFETEASKTEELETGASTASDSFEQARPDETACGGSFLDQDGCNRDTADVSIHDSATGGSSQLLDSAEKRRQREDTVARRIRARRNLAKTDMSPEFGMRIQGNRRNDHTNKNVDIHEEMTEFDDREIGRANFDVQDMYSVSSPKDIVDCGPSPGSCDVLEQVEISPKDMSDCGPSPGSCNIFEQFELLKPEQIGRTVRFDLTEKAGHRVKNKAGNRLVGEGDEKGGPESGLGSGSECNSRTDVGSLCGKTPLKSILKKSRGSKSASLQKDIGLLHEKRVAEFSSMDGRSGGRAEDKHKGGFNEVAVIAKGSAASEMNVCKVEQNVNKLNYLISQNVEYTTNGDPNGDVHEDPKITESVKCHANSPDGNTPKYKESTKEAFDSQGERDTDKNPQAASKMDPFPGYLKILTSPKDNRLEYTVKELESAQRGDWKEQDADSLVKCLSSWRSKSKADDLGKCWSSPRRKKVVELPDIEKGPTDIFGDRKGADSPEESRGPVLRTSPRRKKNSENVNDNEEVNGKGHGNSKQGLSEIPLIKENAREKASKHLETKRGSNLKRGGKDSGILEKQKEERAPKKSSRKKKNKKDHNVKARSNSSRRDIWIRTDDPVQDNFSAGSFTGDRNRAMGHGLKNDNKECLAALADQGGSLKESSLEKGALESADENLNEQSKEESVIFDGCQCDEILQKNIGDEVGRKSFAKRLSSPRKVNKIVIKHASVGEVAKDDESSRGVDDVILPQGVKERSNDMEFSFNESASDTQGLQSTTGSGMQGASNDVIECTQGVQNDVVSGTQKSPSDTEGSLRIVGANEDYLCIEVVEEEKFDGILAMSEPVSGVDDSQIYIIVEAFDTDANKAEDSLKIEGDLVDAGKQNIGWLVDERIVKDKDSARLEIPCNHSGLVISQSDSVAKQDADYSLSNLDYRNPLSRTTSEETESKTQASDYSRSDLDYRNTLSRVTSEEKKSKKSITNQSTLTDNVTQVADYSRSELDYRDSESKSNKETESTRSSADDSCDLSGANPSIGSAGNDLVNALGAIDDNATQGYSPIKDRMIDLSNHDCQSPYNHPSDSTDGLGFKILSRDVTSDVSDSSNHESNFLEMYGRQKDNFVIYLSDDSNDSSRDQVIAKDKKGKTGVEENSNDVIEDDRTINDQVNTKLDSVSEQANTEDATQINEDKCDFVIDGKQSISDRFDFDNQTKLGHGKLGSNHTNASHHVRDDDIITTVRVKNDCVLVNDQAGNVIKDGQARTAMVTNSDCIHDSTRPLVSNTKRKEGNITVSEEAANVNPMNKSVSTAASTKSVNEKSHLIPQQLLIANEEECVDRQSFPSCVSTEGMNIDRQNEFSCEPARGLNIEKETKTTRKKLHKKSRSRKRKASGTHSVEVKFVVSYLGRGFMVVSLSNQNILRQKSFNC